MDEAAKNLVQLTANLNEAVSGSKADISAGIGQAAQLLGGCTRPGRKPDAAVQGAGTPADPASVRRPPRRIQASMSHIVPVSLVLAPARRRFLLAGATALGLAGCTRLIGPVSLQLYRLQPNIAVPPDLPPDLPAVRWQVAVAMPDAPEAFDTERIALSRSNTTLDYFGNAAWTDKVPELLQGLLIAAFEDTGKMVAVSRDAADLRSDYLLQCEIRDFHARYDDPADMPTVDVRIESKLIKMPERANSRQPRRRETGAVAAERHRQRGPGLR